MANSEAPIQLVNLILHSIQLELQWMSSAKAVSLKKLTSQTSASASAPLLHLRATEVLLKIAMYSILEAILDRVQLELKRLDGSLLRRDPSQFDRGDISFIIVAGAMVSFMIPGLAFLYSGLARRKSALSLIWAVSASNAVGIFQWYFWGYSLAFSSTATNGYIGNLRNFGLRNVLGEPSPGSPLIPELLYSFYQMEFACVTVAILMGAIAERGRVFPAMIFSFVWMTLVYCPLACWAWSINGWAFKWGVMDYAGGGPVEIGSGISGLAYSWVLGRRREKELINFRPHNVSMVGLGTFILWFGWLGFNGGSAFGANLRAIMAVWNSMIAAAFGGITWCLLDYRVAGKFSMVGFCSGTIAGLVAATPASGYIPPWAALVMGVLAGSICNFCTKLKFYLHVDDALDLAAEHAIGGVVGLLANGFFGSGAIIALDGVNTSIQGGFLDSNWKQLYIQFAYVCATVGYSFVVTAIIAKLIDMIPGLHLRTTEEGESLGMDDMEIGEFANDYVEVRRDFLAWSPPSDKSDEKYGTDSEVHVAAGDRHGIPDICPHNHNHSQPKHENGIANGNRESPLSPVNEKPENGDDITPATVGDHRRQPVTSPYLS